MHSSPIVSRGVPKCSRGDHGNPQWLRTANKFNTSCSRAWSIHSSAREAEARTAEGDFEAIETPGLGATIAPLSIYLVTQDLLCSPRYEGLLNFVRGVPGEEYARCPTGNAGSDRGLSSFMGSKGIPANPFVPPPRASKHVQGVSHQTRKLSASSLLLS